MTVIAFAPRPLQQDGTWRAAELTRMQTSFACELGAGEASGWHVAATEAGDPQFYLLGPKPEEECILSISRLGRLYVLEDGAGRIVYEDVNLERLTEQAQTFLRGTKSALVARFVLMWAAVRHAFEEKIEPGLAESEELLLHVAPQLASIV